MSQTTQTRTATQLPAVLPLRGHDCLDGGKTRREAPLVPQGLLDKFEHFESTPVIGREYANLNVRDLLTAPDGDAKFADLAATGECLSIAFHGQMADTNCSPVSRRGVVFLRDQDITPAEMEEVGKRLSTAGGCVSAKLKIR